jgi:2-C-methyl-D-erythritol 4-phosphate cytidylyltransferase/2-C-methyl-D-erythritol 2,4-cyclodiphosphate synthase
MKQECWAIVLAAGQGTRLCSATGGESKQFLRYRGAPLWWSAVQSMAASPLVHGIAVVFPPGRMEDSARELARLTAAADPGVPVLTAAGGLRRQDSVAAGLRALPPSCSLVLVHDSARPFASAALATRLLLRLEEERGNGASGVIPGLPVIDTIKRVDGDGACLETPERASLRAVQTPQAFLRAALEEAHARAAAGGWGCTDDASLLERCGMRVLVAPGEEGNTKITRPADLDLLLPRAHPLPCCGYGYDVHALGGSRPLRLGGVPINGGCTVFAHSDGDVLLHALMDAILGCFGGGDIGRLFPDNDPQFDGFPSPAMLAHVLDLAGGAGVRIVHADLTVIAQKPKLAPQAAQIQENVARLLALAPDHVGFKATTEEHLGFTGEGKGIKAVALVSALRG